MAERELRIKPELQELTKLYAFGEENALSDQMILALEEAVVNTILYSGANCIKISCGKKENQLILTLQDDGTPFDPTTYTIPPTSPPVNEEELIPGGKGIHLIKALTDRLEYNRIENNNILKLIKDGISEQDRI